MDKYSNGRYLSLFPHPLKLHRPYPPPRRSLSFPAVLSPLKDNEERRKRQKKEAKRLAKKKQQEEEEELEFQDPDMAAMMGFGGFGGGSKKK